MRYIQQDQKGRLIPTGSLVRMIPKPELPEDVKPYGHRIESLDAFRAYEQTSLDITVFNKGTLALLVEHHKNGIQAAILVQEKMFAVHYQFLEQVKAISLPVSSSLSSSSSS